MLKPWSTAPISNRLIVRTLKPGCLQPGFFFARGTTWPSRRGPTGRGPSASSGLPDTVFHRVGKSCVLSERGAGVPGYGVVIIFRGLTPLAR